MKKTSLSQSPPHLPSAQAVAGDTFYDFLMHLLKMRDQANKEGWTDSEFCCMAAKVFKDRGHDRVC